MAFPTTRWTFVRQAVGAPTPESRLALEELCRAYSGPVFAFVRRRVNSREQAEDLSQEFFSRLLDGRLLGRVDPQAGMFRSFLLNAVRDFLADAHDHEQALKRGGGRRLESLSGLTVTEPMTHLTPDEEFDVQWARLVLARSLDRLRDEYQGDRAPLFASLQQQLSAADETSGRDLARQLRMSEGAVRVALHRLRQRLGTLIREEIAETVPDGADIDDEIKRLRKALETSR
jgi:RNA polymerase sigma factor (sigma-70 family)